MRELRRLDTDDQNVAALRKQLSQFAENRVGQVLLIGAYPRHLDHKGKAGGKGDGEVGTASSIGLFWFVDQIQGFLLEQQMGGLQFKPEIKETFMVPGGAQFLSDLISEGGDEGREPARGCEPRAHWLAQIVRPPIKDVREQFTNFSWAYCRALTHLRGFK